MEKRIYCKYCGAKLKTDCCGLICPQNYTHENNEEEDTKPKETETK